MSQELTHPPKNLKPICEQYSTFTRWLGYHFSSAYLYQGTEWVPRSGYHLCIVYLLWFCARAVNFVRLKICIQAFQTNLRLMDRLGRNQKYVRFESAAPTLRILRGGQAERLIMLFRLTHKLYKNPEIQANLKIIFQKTEIPLCTCLPL